MKFIKNWDELKEVANESDTHTLDIKDDNGWIIPRDTKARENREKTHYLSIHTFYEESRDSYTETLQSCGFNVILGN